jgi:hypothetical protein
MRIAKRTGIMIEQTNQLVMQRTANRSPKRAPRRGKRKSNMRGKKRRIVDFDLHDDFELFSFSPDEIEIPTPSGIRCNKDMGIRCNKDKLVQICDILGIDKSVILCLKGGFNEEALDNQYQAVQRAKCIVRSITKGICELVCPSNLNFQSRILASEANSDLDFQLLFSNASKLVFFWQ